MARNPNLTKPAAVDAEQPPVEDTEPEVAPEQQDEADRVEAEQDARADDASVEAMEQAEAMPVPPAPDRPADQTDTPPGMVRVKVLKPFALNTRHTVTTYTPQGTNCGLPGEYDLSPEDADHWFTKFHLVNPPPDAEPMPGTQRAVEVAQSAAARRQRIEAAIEQQEQAAYEEERRARQSKLRQHLGPSFEPNP